MFRIPVIESAPRPNRTCKQCFKVFPDTTPHDMPRKTGHWSQDDSHCWGCSCDLKKAQWEVGSAMVDFDGAARKIVLASQSLALTQGGYK